MKAEPDPIKWVAHAASGRTMACPPADQWRAALPALSASRLTAYAAWLLRRELPHFPADLRKSFAAASLYANAVSERGKDQLRTVSRQLNDLGVPWLVLKSWPLAARLYPDPGCRPSGDLDVLVQQSDVGLVIEVLTARGYRREGVDQGYHHRLVRGAGESADVLELHYHAAPLVQGGPATASLLERRVAFQSEAGDAWVPNPEDELDLLIRHYVRHGCSQAIQLLDMVRVVRQGNVIHPLGGLVALDLARLELSATIGGSLRVRQRPLSHWMARRDYLDRRASRHKNPPAIALAIAGSPGGMLSALFRIVWPSHPTPRWKAMSRTPSGRYSWRLLRLLRAGR